MKFLLEQSNVKLSDINEDIWDKSGEKYQPLKDSKYLKLQKKPINTLSLDEIKYLYVINRASSSFIRYDSIEQAIEREIDSDRENSWDSEIFEECYKYLHSLKFPLTIYRAIRTDEINEDGSFNISGSNNSRSWSTNINIYKDKLSSFRSLSNIVSAKINADIIDNSATIVNYYFYTGGRNVRKQNYGEYEITLKKNFKQNDLYNLHFIDKDNITESLSTKSKEQALNKLDDLFGQDNVYMWSTYILPNGHFLNPDNPNAKTYWNEIDAEPEYEHSDFIYNKYNPYGEDLFDECIKMNVTYPYIALPEKGRWTENQQKSIRKVLENKSNFVYDNEDLQFYDLGNINVLNMKEPLMITTPFGDTAIDLSTNDEYDVIKLINKGYITKSFTNNINEELSSEQLKEIKDYFGTTYYKSAAFYLLQDGTLLDGSDYKNGSGSYTRRVLDHRDISDVYNGDMYDFINEGNIRLMPESPGISIMKEPTIEQYATLKSYIDNYLFKDKVFYIDILNSSNGDTIKSFEYSWPENKTIDVLNDLVDYFKSV